MEQLIAEFSKHLKDALQISTGTVFHPERKASLAICCGMGGSGIVAKLVGQYFSDVALSPVLSCSGYDLPAFAGKDSLVVICSYSGNTEETLSCMDQAMSCGAQICVLSSGGIAVDRAAANDIPVVLMPGGMPPRAAFAYSFVLLISILKRWQALPIDFKDEIRTAAEWLDAHEDECRDKAQALAAFLKDSIPVLYGDTRLEGVLIRFRQQLAENSKMLSWHNSFPEMNHNELVGWRRKGLPVKVLIFHSKADDPRVSKRMEVTTELIDNIAGGIETIETKGIGSVAELLYLVHTCDWASYYLAGLNGVDAMEIKAIDHLKDALNKFNS